MSYVPMVEVSPDIVTSRHNITPIINLTFRPSASNTQDIDIICIVKGCPLHKVLLDRYPSFFPVNDLTLNCLCLGFDRYNL